MLTQLRNPTSSNKKLQPCKDFNLRQYTSIRTNAADQKKKKKKKKKVYLACPCMLQCVSGLVDKEARHGRAPPGAAGNQACRSSRRLEEL
jgi:hypothetical protein